MFELSKLAALAARPEAMADEVAVDIAHDLACEMVAALVDTAGRHPRLHQKMDRIAQAAFATAIMIVAGFQTGFADRVRDLLEEDPPA